MPRPEDDMPEGDVHRRLRHARHGVQRKGRHRPARALDEVPPRGVGAKDGLVHISQLADQRVAKTTDVVKEGDKVWVKLLGFDERGKVRLSMKVLDQATGKEIAKEEAAE